VVVAAMIFVTAVAIFPSVFPRGELGRAPGLTTMSAYLGLTLGPILGGIRTELFGWRSIFLVNVPLGALACLVILRYLPWE
jgi:MFS family permease